MKLIVAVLLLLVATNANAYLDPGTGSMMLQVILGGVAAASVAIKLYWHNLMAVFGIRKKPADDEDQDGAGQDGTEQD